MTLGENIRLFRKVTGISQAKLASKLYVTPQAVSRWENNETQPDIDTLNKMAEIFDTTVDALINGDKSVIKSIKAMQAYHLLCLVGGCFTTIFAILFTALMIVNGRTTILETIYVVVSLIFLVSILVFEIRAKRLEKLRRARLHKGEKENENLQKN